MSATALPSPATAPAPPRAPRALVDRGFVRRDAVRADRWRLKGTAKILGPIEVGSADIDGTLVAAGGIAAGAWRSRGSLDIAGPIDVRDALRTDGSFVARSSVRAGEGELRGTVRLDAGAEAVRRLAIQGTLRATSLQAGELRLGGSADVAGTVRANTFVASFGGDAHLGAIEARDVLLHGHRENVLDRALLRRTELSVDRIEADRVELVAAEVEFVRAPEIVLGPAAHVRRLEGAVVRAHPTSRVGPESRAPLPAGLRR